jgi:RHS repeat-associated protein
VSLKENRLTKRIDPDGKWIAYGYDVAGNRTLVKTALGETRYTFDERNWLDTVIAASGTTDYDYNAIGNLVHTHFGNGTEENRQYDDLNRLKYLENKEADGDMISSYTYTLDKVGNRQSVIENDGRTVNYTYDELYRLTQEEVLDAVNGDRTASYVYDNVGNRLTKTDSVEGTTTYTYDNNDRLLAEKVDGQVKISYTYDDNGNTLTKTEPGQQTNYTWDDQNRLVAADIITPTGTKHLEYEYDTSGIRVASKVDGQETRYLIDANQPYAQVLEEYTTDGTVLTAYVYGNDLLSQTQYDPQTHVGSTTYYHVDGLGSTTALTDETGTVVSTSRYDAFGEKTGETGTVDNKYLFAGEQYDSNLGDYYLRARYYDATTGQFIRRDTYSGTVLEPISFHKYLYANANPVNATDPTGLYTLMEQSRVTQEIGRQAATSSTIYTTTPFALQAARVTAGILALFAGAAASAFLLNVITTKNGSKDETEFKLYPNDKKKRTEIDEDTRKANQMRVQLQYMNMYTHAIALLNTEETGVTKLQVRTGLVQLWETTKTHATWFNLDAYRSAFMTAIVKTSEWLKGTAPVSGGGTVHSEQWDYNGKKVTKGPYRVDTENLRGKNLQM